MMFEVKKDGKVLMNTESEKCMYSDALIKQMEKDGYKIYLNGKIYKTGRK